MYISFLVVAKNEAQSPHAMARLSTPPLPINSREPPDRGSNWHEFRPALLAAELRRCNILFSVATNCRGPNAECFITTPGEDCSRAKPCVRVCLPGTVLVLNPRSHNYFINYIHLRTCCAGRGMLRSPVLRCN